MAKQNKQVLVLLDAHSILHRAYHALPPLTSPEGKSTGALYGFASMLLKIIRELKPDYIVACYDLPEPTFRHVVYKKYKAQRPKADTELVDQLIRSRDIVGAFGVPVCQAPGFEADDIIGTIVEKVKSQKSKVKSVIATGDLDALQLVDDENVAVYTSRKGIQDTVQYDKKAVKERYGFGPEFLADFKGLKGDPSDNIPGVPGIGEKTATELIQKFGHLENILKLAEKSPEKLEKGGVKKRIIELLKKHKEGALLSKTLGLIHVDAPIEFELEEAKLHPDFKSLEQEFAKLGFNSLLARLKDLAGDKKRAAAESGDSVPTLKQNQSLAALRRAKQVFWFLEDGKAGAVLDNNAVLLDKKIIVQNKKELGEILKNKQNIAFDAKSLLHYFSRLGMTFNFTDDMQIMFWLCDSRRTDPELEQMINVLLPDQAFAVEKIRGRAALLPEAFKILKKEIAEKKLNRVYKDIELPLVKVLADMEERGILIDRDFLKELSKKYDKALKGLEEEIFKLAGAEFNVNSPSQVGEILFEKLGLATKGIKKTKGGAISTRFSELIKLKGEHPIVGKILSFREFAKLKSTYIDVLPGLADKKERLHTSFHQTGTSTGRLSSSDPNLQNIPIKSEFGKDVRRAFVADNGYMLLAFDYSQIELRVAAILSKDKKMTEAFLRGEDIHTVTAKEIFNVKESGVTKEMRRQAKVINFGILYGMGVNRLRQELGVTREEAQSFLDEYFKDFEGVAQYVEKAKQVAEEKGYAETLFGRKRFLPEIYSTIPHIKSEAERMAVNMPVQGTATGDIIKLGMIEVDEFLQAKKEFRENVKMILQIHDELLFEVKRGFEEKAIKRIKEILEKIYKDKVPLVVNAAKGPNWADLRPA